MECKTFIAFKNHDFRFLFPYSYFYIFNVSGHQRKEKALEERRKKKYMQYVAHIAIFFS